MTTDGSQKTDLTALLLAKVTAAGEGQKTNVLSSEEKKAQITAAVAEMIKNEKTGISDTDVAAMAEQIVAAVAGTVAGAVNSAVGDKASSGNAQTAALSTDTDLETTFKAKISEVLTGKGIDQETADRIAAQVKKVTFSSVQASTEATADQPSFDKLVQAVGKDALPVLASGANVVAAGVGKKTALTTDTSKQ